MPDLGAVSDLNAEHESFWRLRPDPLSHVAMARTLTIPDSEDDRGRQEPYDPRSHPAQWHLLQAADGVINGHPSPHRYRRFLFLADAQGGGKSWVLQQIIFHGLVELSQAVIWALPTKGMAGDLWNLKLRPAWEGSGLGVYLPLSGPGSRGSAAPRSIRTQRLDGRGGGTLVFMSSGGRGQSGQAGLTAKRLIVDELSDWDKAAFTRIRKRISKNNEIAVEWYGSTLKLDAGDLTNETYAEGTKSRVEYECPSCKGYTLLEWKTWHGGDDPHLVCLANGCLIREAERRQMLGVHRLTLPEPDRDILSLKSTALDCPWKSLAWLAGEEAKAKASEALNNFEPMRTFYHDERVEGYIEPIPEGEISTKYLSELSKQSITAKRTVPVWVKFLTIAQDPGKHVHYWLVQGHGEGGRWCIIDWGYEQVVAFKDGKPVREPTDADHISVLNIIRDKARAGWHVEGTDRAMCPVQCGVDVGYEMKLHLAWLAGEPEWKPMRGLRGTIASKRHDETTGLRPESANDKRKLCDEIERSNSMTVFRPKGWRIYLYGLIGDAIRHNVHAGLLRKAGDPGSGVIPAGLKGNDMLVLHLCGEVWQPPTIKNDKQVAGSWIYPHGGWDLLDCLRYSHALAMLHAHHPERYDDGSAKPKPTPKPDSRADDDWAGAVQSWT